MRHAWHGCHGAVRAKVTGISPSRLLSLWSRPIGHGERCLLVVLQSDIICAASVLASATNPGRAATAASNARPRVASRAAAILHPILKHASNPPNRPF